MWKVPGILSRSIPDLPDKDVLVINLGVKIQYAPILRVALPVYTNNERICLREWYVIKLEKANV